MEAFAEDMKNCAIVDGSISLLLVNNAVSRENEQITKEAMTNYTFPQLREITEYLLIYRVYHLRSLHRMFPNLVRIGGKQLFNDQYALVIFENQHLEMIGLQSLKYIERGSVRVENNGVLCYLGTIDWSILAKDGDGKVANSALMSIKVVKNNKESGCLDECGETCGTSGCWGYQLCQEEPCPPGCPHACKKGECVGCHEQCLAGCDAPNNASACHACKNFLSEGKCVQNCPQHLYLKDGWHCATVEQCQRNSRFVLHEGNCTTSCPHGYQPRKNNVGEKWLRECVRCNGTCYQVCEQCVHKIDSLHALENFKAQQCTSVKGRIEMTGLTNVAEVKEFYSMLEETFSIVEEIGSIVVSKSYLLSSLHFFSNLKTITGKEKYLDMYSVYVLDNRNLKDLWDTSSNKQVEIKSGKSFFYYNPMLCKDIIERVIDLTPDTEDDLDHKLNGEKAACSSQTISTSYKTVTDDAGVSSLMVTWENPQIDPRRLIYYRVYYQQSAKGGASKFSGVDYCGKSSWSYEDISPQHSSVQRTQNESRHVIEPLTPFTWYAFYVSTSAVGAQGAESDISYAKTQRFKPSRPTYLDLLPVNSTALTLTWRPPRNEFGIMHSYIVTWTKKPDNPKDAERIDNCHPKRYRFSKPTPHDTQQSTI